MLQISDYKTILEKFVASAESFLGQGGLTEIKSQFNGVINSKRRSSSIDNFNELVAVLEKRGHVTEHCIVPLRTISERFNDPHLKGLMDHYEECLDQHRRTFFNFYARPNPIPRATRNAFDDHLSTSPLLSYQPSLFSGGESNSEELGLPENVVELICTEIGKQWMELARKLTIREGEIDSINDKYPSDLKAKAREVLKLFSSKTDPEKLQLKLLDALVQARRRDLKEKAEELLTRRHR